jgi:hypothetical protein
MEAMKSRGAKDGVGRLRWIALLAAAVALPGYGQAGRPAGAVSSPRLLKIFATPAQGEIAQGKAVQGEVVREIDDPHTGQRWLLVRDGQQPGGPGRLLLAGQAPAEQVLSGPVQAKTIRREPGGASRQIAAAPAELRILPVIRAGDRLVVEEHTPVVDAVLEARALNPAARGSAFEARLSIGGRVVRVVALGPGRAELEAETGGRP